LDGSIPATGGAASKVVVMSVVGGPSADGTARQSVGRSRVRVAALALAATLALGGIAQAQFVERNLPPPPPRPGEAIRFITPELLKGNDDTPLGTDLQGIALIGVKDQPLAALHLAGIDLHRVKLIEPAAVEARLRPFLGQPLSRKLIAEIQNAITTVYREAGHSFVSVTIPPQEITGGALQLRVFEYRLGKVAVAGATRTPEDYIRERVRLTPGEPVDTNRLETDLDWLNRNPFRRVEAVFGPGRDLAQTDLTLRATETRPWQVYGGYANTGTLLTDRDRFFVGATAALYGDVIGAYQATGSKDYWGTNGHPFGDPGDSQYMSQAARLSIPLWARSSIELTGDYIQTNELPNTFFL
jgi:hemolysin activation/secretion protein